MPVIGINQVPANFQTPSMWDRFGAHTGRGLSKLEDAILAYLSGGAYQGQKPSIPNPSYGQSQGLPGINPDVSMSYDPSAFPQAPRMPTQNPQDVMRQFTTPAQPPIFPTDQKMISQKQLDAAKAIAEINDLQAKTKARGSGTPYFNLQTGEVDYIAPAGAKPIPVSASGIPLYDSSGNVVTHAPPGSRPLPGAGDRGGLGAQIDAELGVSSPIASTPLAAKGQRVRVQSPDGTVGTLPVEELQEAIKQGFKKL